MAELFDNVASKYDLMNDLMSMGIHRFWKDFAVQISELERGNQVLDVAGGTGDMAKRISKKITDEGNITICDISHDMITTGRDRLIDSGIINNIRYVQGDAENLPFADNSFDFICIAFGLRNVTDKKKALSSMYDKLKYGRALLILEFSKVILAPLQKVYDTYSNYCIPEFGKYIAGDEASYRYLVESIRMHPDQETLKGMLQESGFSRINYYNLAGGIVAIHKAYKL
jgi:demethylmenaquinone methyltransferase/2-methoxy-6-polyprenyl-1,4-benzoquinol methylase